METAFLVPAFLLTDNTGAGKTVPAGLYLEEEKRVDGNESSLQVAIRRLPV